MATLGRKFTVKIKWLAVWLHFLVYINQLTALGNSKKQDNISPKFHPQMNQIAHSEHIPKKKLQLPWLLRNSWAVQASFLLSVKNHIFTSYLFTNNPHDMLIWKICLQKQARGFYIKLIFQKKLFLLYLNRFLLKNIEKVSIWFF